MHVIKLKTDWFKYEWRSRSTTTIGSYSWATYTTRTWSGARCARISTCSRASSSSWPTACRDATTNGRWAWRIAYGDGSWHGRSVTAVDTVGAVDVRWRLRITIANATRTVCSRDGCKSLQPSNQIYNYVFNRCSSNRWWTKKITKSKNSNRIITTQLKRMNLWCQTSSKSKSDLLTIR